MSKPVIVLVDHLRFVEPLPDAVLSDGSARPRPAVPARFQLLPGAEEVGVVRHVEHALEGDAPGLTSSGSLAHQHRRGAVELLGDLGIARGAEDRAVRVFGLSSAISSGERVKTRSGSASLRRLRQEERGVERAVRRDAAGQSSAARTYTSCERSGRASRVLEVVEADQPPVVDQRARRRSCSCRRWRCRSGRCIPARPDCPDARRIQSR